MNAMKTEFESPKVAGQNAGQDVGLVVGAALRAGLIVLMLTGLPITGGLIYLNLTKGNAAIPNEDDASLVEPSDQPLMKP